ncbi:hypothetical protein [Bacillus sp. JCM 19034]|uniref:hypothetical protein n=1 Tax=Bacillus sp. JCM 19034 TaxID=1481928 RepID=UPI0012E1166D|nr:hypothetical protein [Bacillus sp. JCM 19034]
MYRVTLTVILLLLVFFTVGCGAQQEAGLDDEEHPVVDESPEEPNPEVEGESTEEQAVEPIEEEVQLRMNYWMKQTKSMNKNPLKKRK